MITMYDGIKPGEIPADAEVTGCYPMGDYAWKPADYARFPHAIKVLIAIEFDSAGLWKHCNVADVERYALTPKDARVFLEYRQQVARKGGNAIYCNASTVPAVVAACKGLHYYLWVADWTNTAHEFGGAVAVQYETVPGRYDVSAVYNGDWLKAVDEANRPWPLAA